MASFFKDHIKRSLVKAITYRILILCSDTVIIYAITKRVDITFGVIFLSNFASTIMYFLHERAWNKVHWGRVEK